MFPTENSDILLHFHCYVSLPEGRLFFLLWVVGVQETQSAKYYCMSLTQAVLYFPDVSIDGDSPLVRPAVPALAILRHNQYIKALPSSIIFRKISSYKEPLKGFL